VRITKCVSGAFTHCDNWVPPRTFTALAIPRNAVFLNMWFCQITQVRTKMRLDSPAGLYGILVCMHAYVVAIIHTATNTALAIPRNAVLLDMCVRVYVCMEMRLDAKGESQGILVYACMRT
jgi:hypothetical protein